MRPRRTAEAKGGRLLCAGWLQSRIPPNPRRGRRWECPSPSREEDGAAFREGAKTAAGRPRPADPPRSFAAGTPLARPTALLPAMLDGLKMEETLQSALEPPPASFPALLGKCRAISPLPDPPWQPFPPGSLLCAPAARGPQVLLPFVGWTCPASPWLQRVFCPKRRGSAVCSYPCLFPLRSKTGDVLGDRRWKI